MAEVIWSDSGLRNFRELLEYIEKESPINAQKVANRIWSRIQQLKEFSLLGRVVPEFEQRHIRELIVYNFRVVYRLKDENRVEIIGIHHSARILPPE